MNEYKTAKELREEAKQGNIKYYRNLCEMFDNHPTMELSVMMDDTASTLIRHFGLTPDEIEEIENSIY